MSSVLSGYSILGKIGAGGMATVYHAVQESLDRPVALKVIHSHLSQDSAFRSRFFNEARLMARLSHPNIVQAIDFTETGEGLVIVMEYVDGSALETMIGQQYGPIPHEKALPLFLQVLDGIGYAHSNGVVHRDIKPSNILVSRDGRAKITDFGIAKIAGQKGLTRTGAQMGTLYYESPEQIQGARDVNHRADIYSLGMTLYEMLAGRLPFEGESDTSEFQVMSAIVNRDGHLDPRDYYPYIPEWLVELVQRATHLDPGRRIQSCQEFRRLILERGDLSPGQAVSDYWLDRVGASAKGSPSPLEDQFVESSSSWEETEGTCPECGAAVGKEMEFCGRCGADLAEVCPNCHRKIKWHQEFCPTCGVNIRVKLAEIEAEREHERAEERDLPERGHEDSQAGCDRDRPGWHRHLWKVMSLIIILVIVIVLLSSQ